jgi:hypothetical protein
VISSSSWYTSSADSGAHSFVAVLALPALVGGHDGLVLGVGCALADYRHAAAARALDGRKDGVAEGHSLGRFAL